MFRRSWVQFVDAAPRAARRIRYWDRAATEVTKDSPDPDWTVGVLMAIAEDGLIYIEDVVRFRGGPMTVEQMILATAEMDHQTYGLNVTIGIEQDPGSAGKSDAANYVRLLSRFNTRVFPVSKAKVVRFGPFSAQAEGKNVRIKRADWNEAYLRTLEKFPTPGVHDDDVDATSGAYNALKDTPQPKPRAAAAQLGPGSLD
nr:phage terminase large subunit [Deinococcus sp. JMULE3]